MSTLSYAVSDSATMVRRVLTHTRRNPSTLLMAVTLPLILLCLMNYAFGGSLDVGGGKYVDYLIPGIILMGASYSTSATAVAVATDMGEGVIDRFRTLPISRGSVLTGHVVGNIIRTGVGVLAVVGVGMAMGFRAHGSAVRWLAAAGVVVLTLLAVSWLATGIGLSANGTSSAASNASLVTLLPFLSGAFAPIETMPGWLKSFSANEPMTHIIDSLRALLLDQPVGDHLWLAVVWCGGIALVSYVWAKRTFGKKTVR
ncbi:ABC transporter permease [Kitasatospora sp. NBC_00315]|uniref:ABC transporter permease n=1 Tax=Kitasatospora sp. NBC_00315 TaxID=2975963 RepID=UPI003253183D